MTRPMPLSWSSADLMDIHQGLFGSGGQRYAGRGVDDLGPTTRTKEVSVLITEWVPFNLADSREALQKWTTMEQRGQWIVGYHQGASGALLIGGEPDALVDGYRCGERAHNDSSIHRAEVSERRRESAQKRWNRDLDANAHANAHANAYANAYANASCKTHAQDRTGQDITEQDTTTTRAGAAAAVAKEEPASKIVQEAWEDLLDQGYKAVRYKAWSPKMTRQAHELMKLYKNFDFDDLFRRALAIMGNDQWLKDHPHHFNVQRILRPDIFAMYADKVELPTPLMDELPIEANP